MLPHGHLGTAITWRYPAMVPSDSLLRDHDSLTGMQHRSDRDWNTASLPSHDHLSVAVTGTGMGPFSWDYFSWPGEQEPGCWCQLIFISNPQSGEYGLTPRSTGKLGLRLQGPCPAHHHSSHSNDLGNKSRQVLFIPA